jgi:CLIP-associating protein 1/2
MTKNHGLLFRQYVPSLVACLEDADSAVRDTARLVVVELFRYVYLFLKNFSRLTSWLRNAPARAKSDLQKQLIARGVRKSIASAIISGIGLGDSEPVSSNRPISRAERPISVMSSRSHARELVDDGMIPNFSLLSPKRAALISVKSQNPPKAVQNPQGATMIDLPLLQKPH